MQIWLNLLTKSILIKIMSIWREKPHSGVVSLNFGLRRNTGLSLMQCKVLLVSVSVSLSLYAPSPCSTPTILSPSFFPAVSFRLRMSWLQFLSSSRGHLLFGHQLKHLSSRTRSTEKEVLSRASCCQGNHFLEIQNINISPLAFVFWSDFFLQ